MPSMIIDEDIRPMSEVRAGIASFLKQIHDTKRPLVITQHGKGVAVMLDVGGIPAYAGEAGAFAGYSNINNAIGSGRGGSP